MLNDKSNNFLNKKLKEKWVPKTEEKQKQLEEEDEKLQSFLLLMDENQKQQQQQQQEKKKMNKKEKKVYSSLPSNYVTLAQLQQRWLKQKQQHEEKGKKEEDYPPLEQRHVEVMPPTNVTVSRLNILERNLRGKRDESADNRRVIGVESEERRKSVIGAGIADNVTVSRLNPVERNRGGNRDGLENNRRGIDVESEDGRKSVIGDGKSEVEESKTAKNKINSWRRRGKIRAKEEEEKKRAIEEGSAAEKGNEDAEKTVMKIESKEVKKVNSETVEEEVEQKFRVLSLNSENGKQNLKFKKMNHGFRDSQSMRRNHGNGGGRRGGGYGGHGDFKELQSCNMIWVRKDDSC